MRKALIAQPPDVQSYLFKGKCCIKHLLMGTVLAGVTALLLRLIWVNFPYLLDLMPWHLLRLVTSMHTKGMLCVVPPSCVNGSLRCRACGSFVMAYVEF
jgi:hypothetical protein